MKTNPHLNISLCAIGLFSAAVVLPSHAATITGGDWAGAPLAPADGDILSGTFLNVGSFMIAPGSTVFVDAGVPLEVHAGFVAIHGLLNGNGFGFGGGSNGANGFGGGGPGGGFGGLFGPDVHASGGGGGGFGGPGGHSGQSLGSPPFAAGGGTYGSASDSVAMMGSGGGGAGDHHPSYGGLGGDGGAGGGAISIFSSSTFSLFFGGGISVDGADGQQGTFSQYSTSGGGGGSGGGIAIHAASLYVNGLLSADGGDGADFMPGEVTNDGYGQGGGGGGGGRIGLFTVDSFFDVFTEISLDGGFGGLSDPHATEVSSTDGAPGSLFGGPNGNGHPVPEVQHYASAFGFALAAFEAARRRRARRQA